MTSSDDTVFDAEVEAGLRARVGQYLVGSHEGRGVRVGLACGRFNGGVTTRLLEGALAALGEHGVDRSDITIAWAPGAFELPLVARGFTLGEQVDVVITLGAVIRGDTGHYDVVAGECARGVQDVQLATGVPVVFGVLTTNTVQQALERSQPDDTNKGRESAETALEMVNLLRQRVFSS
ncbi:MAG: 6,7-dimethyl-8-ribityllumazine synthase [Acidimicrobiaceae bacterium]|nr:6,7-dimethyl-8-ribityllumazine synthase [Acidimicrobiaceae bacterium]